MNHWHNIQDFFNMGGYAGYVWSAYGLALIVFLINIIRPIKQYRKLLKQLKQNDASKT